MKSIHTGHRQRLKERFRQEGLDSFDELHVLELLLFYAIPQGDTNPLAHELLKRFGSLTGVLEAKREELEQVKGLGAHSVTLLRLVTELGRYYAVQRMSMERVLPTLEKCGEYLVPFFIGQREETVYLLCLDGKCKVLACRKLGQGGVNSVGVPIRRVVETALNTNASSVILAHNHPSGLALPTTEDVQVTKKVATALDLVGVRLADHVIVADQDFVSLTDSGLYNPERI
mgnify:CR=1 FL=1